MNFSEDSNSQSSGTTTPAKRLKTDWDKLKWQRLITVKCTSFKLTSVIYEYVWAIEWFIYKTRFKDSLVCLIYKILVAPGLGSGASIACGYSVWCSGEIKYISL